MPIRESFPRAFSPFIAWLLVGALFGGCATTREDVWKYRDRGDVQRLADAFGDPSPAVRSAAAAALGELQNPAGVLPLIARLQDESSSVRREAARALGRIKDPRGVAPLVTALKDRDLHVREEAMASLMGMDARAVEPLIEALKDEHPGVRSGAARALDRIRWVPANPADAISLWSALLEDQGLPAERRRRAAQGLGNKKNPGTLAPLLAALKDKESSIRGEAAKALGAMPDSASVEPLITALQDPHPLVRRETAGALGAMKDTRAVGPLISVLLNDRDQATVEATARALMSMGPPAMKTLTGALESERRGLGWQAAEALGRTGDPEAVEPLAMALQESDSYVREVAARALGGIKDARAAESLIGALEDEDPVVRREAAKGLRAIGAPAVEPLIVAIKHEEETFRDAVTGVLVSIGAPAVEPLVASLRDRDPTVRKEAADALVKIDRAAVPSLIAALKDDGPQGQNAAREILIKIGAPAVELLITASKDGNQRVRREAARALDELGWTASGGAEPIRLEMTIRDRTREGDNGNATRTFRKYVETALFQAGFIMTQDESAPLLAIDVNLFDTEWRWVPVSGVGQSIPIKGISGTAVFRDRENVRFRASIAWPKREGGDVSLPHYFTSSLLAELAVAGIRRKAVIQEWLKIDRRRDGFEQREAYKEFARIGDDALPVLKQVITTGRYPAHLNASRALGALASEAAFKVIRPYLYENTRTMDTQSMCEGLLDAWERIPDVVVDELRRFYEKGIDDSFISRPLHELLERRKAALEYSP